MSILNSAVSGMLANSNWLSNISQNVANANSTGYKNADTEFSALVDQSPGEASTGAGVTTTTRSLNAMQGQIESTSTSTDLAVQGQGFFVVSNASGQTFLTRNGSFVPDASGNLVNAAGYYLMAQNTQGTSGNVSVNSIANLQKVNVGGAADSATASTSATLVANLPSTATTVTGNLPSTNTSPMAYTDETTVVAYDDLGGAHTLNVYFSNTTPVGSPPGTNPTWEVDVYDNATATPSGATPYSSGPLVTQQLTFNATTGALMPSGGVAGAGSPMLIPVPGGATVSMDLSNTTQLATTFAVNSATINGNAPGSLSGLAISAGGVLSFQYGNGASQNAYVIPLANVPSPDNLTSALGDAYQTNNASGALRIGNAGTGGLGSLDSSSLEQSTVDLATELTSMVEAQASYQANSKVFQTGSDILSILNNLK